MSDKFNVIPLFRKMIRAIGDHVNPKATAYRYEIKEFKPDGTFIIRPNVLVTETQMRADGDRLYEASDGMGGWALISAAEFQGYEAAWNSLRGDLGYSL